MDDVRAPLPLIQAYDGYVPQIAPGVFIAPNAAVVGKVVLAANVSVWYGAVLRGDIERILVGERSTIQDLCCLHTTRGSPEVRIGADVTLGHGSIVHSATLEDGVFVGYGAIIMDGAVVGKGSIVMAGSLVPRGAQIPAGTMVRGRPAKVLRELSADEMLVGTQTAAEEWQLALRTRAASPGDSPVAWRAVVSPQEEK